MKNKEIEELLNELKDEDNYIEEYGFRYKRIALDDWWLLLSYTEQLQTTANECKQDYQRMKENFDSKVDVIATLSEEKKQLQNNRDKAIDYLEKSKLNQLDTNCKYLHIDFDAEKIENIDELIDILKGDSE